jgi:hypothetical protein
MSDEINFPPQDEMPQSMDEAATYLADMLPADSLEQLRRLEEEDIIQTHFGLGMYVRNHLSLWNPQSRIVRDAQGRFGVSHEDDVLMEIIRILWVKLHAE